MNELVYFVMIVNVIPAFIGFYLAKRRGKNPYLWAFLAGLCAFSLFILHIQYKPLPKDKK
jgi:hypothetical protein